jgi:hypothetical protein
LIDLSVAPEPHVYLKIYSGTISEQGHTQYHDCRICAAKLAREQADNDPDSAGDCSDAFLVFEACTFFAPEGWSRCTSSPAGKSYP